MGVLAACMSVHRMYARYPQRQEEVSDSLEVYLQTVVSMWALIIEAGHYGRAASAFN